MDAAVSEGLKPGLARSGLWIYVAAFALLAIPTVGALGAQVWSRETGAQGPIVLGTGAWLMWRQAEDFRTLRAPGNPVATGVILLLSLVAYIFGRAYDFITFEAMGLYGVGLAMTYANFGLRPMIKNWFPFLYLAFLIPPPIYVLDHITSPLKQFVTYAATTGLQAFGLPLSREGVTIFIAQYQLLVEDACSGMNSIIGLTAISLFYIYLLRGSSALYSLILVCLVIPIAVVANILRIVILILLTYFGGDALAQGFLHFTAGILMFVTALSLVFVLDKALSPLRRRTERPAA
jgi:exosortase